MKIISVNVGMPRTVEHHGKLVSTGIFKTPTSERVQINRLNLAGDGQADLSVHGGWSKAVYVYPVEHYEFWRNELPETDLPHGIFGENLTTEGLFEKKVFIGDQIRFGEIELVVTEPRFPCFKLGIRFGRADIIKRFQQSERSGFYLAVGKTGAVRKGDSIEFISRDENRVSVNDLMRLNTSPKPDFEIIKRALRVESLSDKYRETLLERIGKPTAKPPDLKNL